MEIRIEVTAKIESANMAGEPKFICQGRMTPDFGVDLSDTEPLNLGFAVLPEQFRNTDVGDILRFSFDPMGAPKEF